MIWYVRSIMSYFRRGAAERTTNVYEARHELLTYCKRAREHIEENEVVSSLSSSSSSVSDTDTEDTHPEPEQQQQPKKRRCKSPKPKLVCEREHRIRNDDDTDDIISICTGSSKCVHCRILRFERDPFLHFTRSLCKFAKHRAKTAEPPIPFEITIDDVYEKYEQQKGLCALSGIKMTYIWNPLNYNPKKFNAYRTYNMSLDQIVPGNGYTKDNVQLVVLQCNFMKLNCSQDLFLELCSAVHNHNNTQAKPQQKPTSAANTT